MMPLHRFPSSSAHKKSEMALEQNEDNLREISPNELREETSDHDLQGQKYKDKDGEDGEHLIEINRSSDQNRQGQDPVNNHVSTQHVPANVGIR